MVYYTLGDSVIYWLIRFLVLSIFIGTGYWVSFKYKGSRYWLGCLPAIIIYSLAEGLRWDRGIDYYHYYQDLTGGLYSDYKDFFYTLWITFFKSTGLPFWIAFIFYSFLLIVSFLLVLKKLPKTAFVALPLFFIMTVYSSENLIRQFISIPFVLFGLFYYIKRNYVLMTILFVISANIHYSSVFVFFVFFLCYLVSRHYHPHQPILLVIIFVFLNLFWEQGYFNFIADYLSSLSFDKDMAGSSYLSDAKIWFSDQGSLAIKNGTKIIGLSFANRIIRFFSYLLIIILGFYSSKNCGLLKLLFYVSYIGLIIDVIKGDIEIYIRLYNWLIVFIPLIIGLIAYKQLRKDLYLRIIFFCCIFMYYGYIQFLSRLFIVERYAFIWDR